MSAALLFLRRQTNVALILLLGAFILGIEIVRPGTVTLLWLSTLEDMQRLDPRYILAADFHEATSTALRG